MKKKRALQSNEQWPTAAVIRETVCSTAAPIALFAGQRGSSRWRTATQKRVATAGAPDVGPPLQSTPSHPAVHAHAGRM